jgi:putative phosphoribosyl transferase
MRFADRADAGRRLAAELEQLPRGDVVVVGLPRGGLPVAFEVAQALRAPLDVIVVRKVGVPFQPEWAMGAVGEDGVQVVNDDVVRAARISATQLADAVRRERAEVENRARRFRGGRPRIPLTGRVAVLVDDGMATGATMRAACQVAREHGARRVVVAVPVASRRALSRLHGDADEVVCPHAPRLFHGVGQSDRDFAQVTGAQVVELLGAAAAAHPAPLATPGADRPGDHPPVRDDEVTIPVHGTWLSGHLTIPERALGVVLFAHGSGSGRYSPRNQYVAGLLNQAGLGTLLMDLLVAGEELDRANVFDVALLAGRLTTATRWLAHQPGASNLPVGYFGASTGAAAALIAAAAPDGGVAAVVSRGGRPDLAGDRLPHVRVPTLLVVGGLDDAVLELNRAAQDRLECESRLEVVPGATHLFEEPGTLHTAAELARDWFLAHLAAGAPPRPLAETRHRQEES